MARLVYRKMALQRTPHQAHVANEVEQLMAGRFVWKIGVGGVEDSVVDPYLRGILVKGSFQTAQLPRSQLFIHKDQGIVQTAALDKVEVQEGLYLMQKHKGAAHGYFGFVLRHIGQRCRLPADDALRKVYNAVDREGVGGLDFKNRAGVLVFKTQVLIEGNNLSRSVLLASAHADNLLQPRAGRAVEDGDFAAIQLNERIVDSATVKGGHKVFDGGYAMPSRAYGGAAGCFGHMGGQRRHGDDIESVGTAEGDTIVGVRWPHGDGHRSTRMQTHACHSELFAQRGLVHRTGIKWKSLIR